MARRYVMATREDGLSDVIIENEVAEGGVGDLWINDETPADISRHSDPTTPAPNHEPPDGGAIFRVVTFTREMNATTPEMAVAMHRQLKSVHVPTLEYLRAAKHPSMHKTDTLNYFVCVSGRIRALSEGKDVLLEPGDFIIQHGCMHGWWVESDEPAVIAAVLIDAKV